MDIVYSGEALLPGRIGHLLLIISFVTSVVALISYYFSTNATELQKGSSWAKIGNISFFIHFAAVAGVMITLYYLIFNHHFEYDYVRRHSSLDMPIEYLVSGFWSGQQGSFLLWIFFNALLGMIIIPSATAKWRAPVMAVFAGAQIILTSMLLGIYIERGFTLLLLLLFLQAPLWILLNKNGEKGWKSLIPVFNIVTVAKLKDVNVKWLLFALALPVNFILFIWFPFNFNESLAYITETIRIGVSPFVLSRHEFSDNAIFLFPDYLDKISGQGLNPLLQNYWMVIHPPTLFVGFASTIIPFAFGVAGLWRKDFGGWIKPALPWAIFSAMILGLGIMLGGMWAYEALSFGGFWAWDPVENASFVPWLALVAGIHTMLAYKHSGHALKVTYIFFILAFFLILYSTFLTRSGILGESSVHSFTDLGMMGQLIILILALMIPSLVMLTWYWKDIPSPKKEESAYSREFWLFIGALILLISAIQITFSTSTPVFNSIFKGINSLTGLNIKDNYALPEDVVTFYNSIQVWLGIIIAFLTAVVQFFRYKNDNIRKVLVALTPAFIGSLILTGLLEYLFKFDSVAYMLLLFSGIFAVLANLQYAVIALKGKLKFTGASIAHIGFGLVMIGLIVSLSKSFSISKNYMNIDYGEGFDRNFKENNIYLLKNRQYWMDDYMVTYEGRTQDGRDYNYKINYKRVNPKTGELIEDFTLEPHLLNHPDMGIVANPSTKHYLDRDIFTHVTSIPMAKDKTPVELPVVSIHEIGRLDSFFTSVGVVRFDNVQTVANDYDAAAIARLRIDNMDQTYIAEPMFAIKDGKIISEPYEVEGLNLSIQLMSIDPTTGKFSFRVVDDNDWLILKAIVFPYINVLWIGITITILGFFIAMFRRIREYDKVKRGEIA